MKTQIDREAIRRLYNFRCGFRPSIKLKYERWRSILTLYGVQGLLRALERPGKRIEHGTLLLPVSRYPLKESLGILGKTTRRESSKVY